jgi:hypothetical protein
MDEATKEQVRRKIEGEARQRFPGAVRRVALLQHGDEPVVEPGELLVRVIVEPPVGTPDGGDPLRAFEEVHRAAMKELRRDLSTQLPDARQLEFALEESDGQRTRIVMRTGGGPGEGGVRIGHLTPVMARLGSADLETVDALITAGIATNRAEAIRWTLARIRERPAYEQLRSKAEEIERLKSEF